MKLLNLLPYTIRQFFQIGEVRREVCKIASSCSGGGGGAVTSVNGQTGEVELSAVDIETGGGGETIQDVLDRVPQAPGSGINFQGTPNSVNLGLDLATIGTTQEGLLTLPTYLVMGDLLASNYSGLVIPGSSNIQISNNAGTNSTGIILQSGNDLNIQKASSGNFQRIQFTGTNQMLVEDSISNTGLEYTQDYSTNYTDRSLVDKAYVDLASSLANPNVVFTEQPVTPTLQAGTYYTSTSADSITLDMPDATTSTGRRIGVINQGSNDVTLNAFTAGQIFTNGISQDTLVLGAGETNILYCNSISWVTVA